MSMPSRAMPGDLFTSRPKDGKPPSSLTFVALSTRMEFFDLVVEWTLDILRHEPQYTKEMLSAAFRPRVDNIFIGLLGEIPVASFALRDHHYDETLEIYAKKAKWLSSIYIDKRCRGLGFFWQITREIESKLSVSTSSIVLFDSILPSTQALYEKWGARVIKRDCLSYFVFDPKNKRRTLRDEVEAKQSRVQKTGARKVILYSALAFLTLDILSRKVTCSASPR